MNRISMAALGVALLSSRPVLGTVLTLDDALARARREAPAVVAARLRPDEARGRLAGASVWLRDNPVIEGTAGRRDANDRVSTDIETGVSQSFELGRRRRSRIAGAQAEVARETASAENATREALLQVATSFMRAVAADDRLRVLRANETLARELLRVAERRHQAGDIADLDRNVARIAAARARAELSASEAARELGLAELKVALGMDAAESLEVRGELRIRPERGLDDLLSASAERPDVRALGEEMRAAEAEAQLGSGLRWPDLGVHVGYKREEGADIPLAGLSASLPIFANGQAERATGAARARRLRVELNASRRAIEVEVRAAFDAWVRLVRGVEDLERNALPLFDDNDGLIRRSYEAGELSLVDYLVVRRETLEARLDYVARSLEAALAGVDLEARAGVLR